MSTRLRRGPYPSINAPCRLMLSPYFSPGQRKICRPSLDRISIHREHDEDQVTNTDPGPVARTGDQFDESLLNDPMFRFYFRKFLNLYQQLSVLKPNLIQGSIARMVSRCNSPNTVTLRICRERPLETAGCCDAAK